MMPIFRNSTLSLAFVLIASMLFSCGKSPTYLSFTARSSTYYANIAGACDTLLLKTAGLANGERKIPGNSNELPEILRELRPQYVVVSTNGVFLLIGVGRGGYGIIWTRSDTPDSTWQLKTVAENKETVHFKRVQLPLL